jgi:hypothetical protein
MLTPTSLYGNVGHRDFSEDNAANIRNDVEHCLLSSKKHHGLD